MSPWPKRVPDPKNPGRSILEPQPVMRVTSWTNLDDLARRFAPWTVRRLQADCLDLPPKLDPVTVSVALDDEEWRHYRSMRDKLVAWLLDGRVATASSAAIKSLRLSQITSGFLSGIEDALPIDPAAAFLTEWGELVDGRTWAEVDEIREEAAGEPKPKRTPEVLEIGRSKLDVTLRFLREKLETLPNFKAVVWVRFRPELARMIREFEKMQADFAGLEVAQIHGAQKRAARQRALRLLKPETSPAAPILVGGTFGTGSYGLDFTASHTSLAASYDASLGKFLQSADRVYGPGQEEPVAYFDVVATGPKGQKTIDHHLVGLRRENKSIADWTTDHWVKLLTED